MMVAIYDCDIEILRQFRERLDDIMRRDDYMNIIRDKFIRGESVAQYCASINIPTDVHYEYTRDNAAYRRAVELAMTHCRAWWDKTGHDAIFDKTVNYKALESQFNRQANSMPACDVRYDNEMEGLFVNFDEGIDKINNES